MISQSLASAFDWQLRDGPTRITATFQFPVTFNLSCVQAELLENGTEVSVSIPDQPFLLAGHLYDRATALELTKDDSNHKIEVTIIKASPGPWNLVVTSWSPTTQCIDPKSAFVIWSIIQEAGASRLEQSSGELLEFAAQAGFVPALVVFGRVLLSANHTTRGIECLTMAAVEYGNTTAASELGFVMALAKGTRERGLDDLRKLADDGVFEANWLLAQLYSPLCHSVFRPKDAVIAFQRFSIALQIKEDDADCMYEIARLLFHGFEGVPQDRQRAEALYAKAKEQMQDLQPLDFVAEDGGSDEEGEGWDEEGEGWSNWLIAGVVVGAVAMVAGALLFGLKRNNR
jgi:hypothetical protein